MIDASLALTGIASLVIAVSAGFLFEGIERKLFARLQNRKGPPITQPLLDALKLLFVKETVIPENASYAVFMLMPYISVAALSTAVLLIPLGGAAPFSFGGDIIVLLYVLALSTIGITMGAAASGSPFARVGASRELTLFISIEFPLALSILTPAIAVASFSLASIYGSGALLPLAAIAFFIAVLAELGKAPFDIGEAEQEIAEGMYAEYSGRLLGLVRLAIAMKHYIYAMVFAVLFVPIPATLEPGYGIALQFAVAILFMCVVSLVRSVSARFMIHQASRFYIRWVALLALIQLALVYLWL